MDDKELLKFVTGFRYGILGKNSPNKRCYMVCLPLQGILSFENIEAKLIRGEIRIGDTFFEHFWLNLPDGRVLDPTASQFNAPDGSKMPEIYIGEKPEWYLIA